MRPRDARRGWRAVGARARELGIRLSTHPGQYTVLNSEDDRVRALAVEELEVQAELMDRMALGPEAVVVLHVGGAAGGRPAALDRFCRGFEALSEAARERLVVENDDRTFSLSDVLTLSERIGRPVVWDILHHHCNDPDAVPDAEALRLALATWPAGVTPKIHFSTPKTAVEEQRRKVGRRIERRLVLPPLRAHADTIDPIAFERFLDDAAGLDFDVMLEAKAKDLALLALRDALAKRGQVRTAGPRRARRAGQRSRRRRRPGRSRRSMESPMSHSVGAQSPTNSARRSALPRSSWSTILARCHSRMHSSTPPIASVWSIHPRRPARYSALVSMDGALPRVAGRACLRRCRCPAGSRAPRAGRSASG
jgi:UV DNA damage endonuclease